MTRWGSPIICYEQTWNNSKPRIEQLKPGIPGLEAQWVSLWNFCDSAILVEAGDYPARLVQVIHMQTKLGYRVAQATHGGQYLKLATCPCSLASFLCWYAQDILQSQSRVLEDLILYPKLNSRVPIERKYIEMLTILFAAGGVPAGLSVNTSFLPN